MNATEYLINLKKWDVETSTRWSCNNVAPQLLAILFLFQMNSNLNRNLLLAAAVAKLETGIVYFCFTYTTIFHKVVGQTYGLWGTVMIALCTPGWLISETFVILSNIVRCYYICGDQKYKRVYIGFGIALLILETAWRIIGVAIPQNVDRAQIAWLNTATWGTNTAADLVVCVRIFFCTFSNIRNEFTLKNTRSIYKIILRSAEVRIIFLILPTVILSVFNYEKEHLEEYLGDPLIVTTILAHNLSAFYFENSPLIFTIDLLLSKMKLTEINNTPSTTTNAKSTTSNCDKKQVQSSASASANEV
ncbi:hypothetical protein HK099_001378 [Clydaea vesicula]|uniref:Uncharacterized protein n=1 Tax=Clydaea vesicula TaxID=447962 RepID=A0AAD5TTW0_9FUNG|nr:hypothetical protein HK099_001378 [Clydaea vesicula]